VRAWCSRGTCCACERNVATLTPSPPTAFCHERLTLSPPPPPTPTPSLFGPLARTCESEAHTSRNSTPSAAQNSFRRSRPSATCASGPCDAAICFPSRNAESPHELERTGPTKKNLDSSCTKKTKGAILQSGRRKSGWRAGWTRAGLRDGQRDRRRAETEEAHRGHLKVRVQFQRGPDHPWPASAGGEASPCASPPAGAQGLRAVSVRVPGHLRRVSGWGWQQRGPGPCGGGAPCTIAVTARAPAHAHSFMGVGRARALSTPASGRRAQSSSSSACLNSGAGLNIYVCRLSLTQKRPWQEKEEEQREGRCIWERAR